jgi:hypothetical protein
VLVRVMSVVLAGSHVAVAEKVVMMNGSGDTPYVQHDRSIARVEEIGGAEDAVAEFATRVSERLGAHGIMTIDED